jgi:undecaprenyl-diphosphatase
VATLPAAIAGLCLEHQIETVFRSPLLIAAALAVLGALLLIADRYFSGRKTVADLTFQTALGVGIAQSLALIPGVSRSGITMTTALMLGFNRSEAARLSFLLSVPIIAGAGLLKFKEILMAPDKAVLWAGFSGAAIAGFLAIGGLLRFVRLRHYTPFVVYRWILAAFVLLNLSHFQP